MQVRLTDSSHESSERPLTCHNPVNTRLHQQTPLNITVVVLDFSPQRRPRPDHTHILLDYVDELRELINAESAEYSANGCHPGILTYLEEHAAGALIQRQQAVDLCIGAYRHCSKFKHREGLAVEADTLRMVEDRSFARQLDSDSRCNEKWRCHDESRQRETEVKGPFLKVLSPRVLRFFDMQQRESGDGLQRQSRPQRPTRPATPRGPRPSFPTATSSF